ncbi:MAG: diaminopimelate epimerase [Magnetococcus sp. DMHC-6]
MSFSTLTVEILKCHGTRNDFIAVDETHSEQVPEGLKKSFSRLVADRQTGIGADGIVFVSAVDAQRPRMRFFNPDGSEAEMCGNGLRCAVRICHEGRFKEQNSLLFTTLGGEFKTDYFISPEFGIPFVRIFLDPVQINPEKILKSRRSKPFLSETFVVHGQEWSGTLLSIGNPHLIVNVADLRQIDLVALGHAMENHPMFTNRANVTFVQLLDGAKILVQTYERGAGLTLACGTGMTSAAVAQVLNGSLPNHGEIEVHLAGGVAWVTPHVEENHLSASLTGNATFLYRGLVKLRVAGEQVAFGGEERVEQSYVYREEIEKYAKFTKKSLFDAEILKGTPLFNR